MGEGGSVVLINATPYTWKVNGGGSYQMNSWSFSDVAPRSYYSGYVEWGEAWLSTISDDSAWVQYAIEGTSNTFQIKASAPNDDFNIAAYLDGIAAYGHSIGDTINLGWSHGGAVSFMLVGTSGNFWYDKAPPAWMHSMLPSIGSQPLRHLCIPGSHDAGMSKLNGGTALVVPGNVLTQTNNIGTQLALGARYFDLRPTISNGQYVTGHYDNTGVGIVNWQGGNGESFDDIISQINTFTASNPELIILNLSNDLDTDAAGGAYVGFTQDQWTALFAKLSGIVHLFSHPDGDTVDFGTVPLNDFIGNGQAAVIIICQFSTTVSFGAYANKGFYPYGAFNIWNHYANSDDLGHMSSDQITKMKQQRTSPDTGLFLLSWTLTQGVTDMAELKSIISLAESALPSLTSNVMENINSNTYPNVVYIDNFVDQTATIVSAAVNYFAVNGVSSRDAASEHLHQVRSRRAFKNIH